MTYVVLPVRESNLDNAPMQTLLVVTSQCFEFHSLVRLSFLSSTTFHLFLEEPIGALIAAGCLHYWPARQGAGSAEKGQEVNLWHINPTVFSTSCLLPKCNFVAFARCGVGNDCLNSSETGCLACTLSAQIRLIKLMLYKVMRVFRFEGHLSQGRRVNVDLGWVRCEDCADWWVITCHTSNSTLL